MSIDVADDRLLRADQKAKARARLGTASSTNGQKRVTNGVEVVDDDMAYFWQCQSPTSTGELKGCGFFKILDMKGEGRGPCVGDVVPEAASDGADGADATSDGADPGAVGSEAKNV